jgi:hypothetical protein
VLLHSLTVQLTLGDREAARCLPDSGCFDFLQYLAEADQARSRRTSAMASMGGRRHEEDHRRCVSA